MGTQAFSFDEAMVLREAEAPSASSMHHHHHGRRVFEGYVSDK